MTADGREALVFEERDVRRAMRRLMSTVRGEGRQLVLSSVPSRLLAEIGSQDVEWLRTEARESLVLVKHGLQLGELVAIRSHLAW
jgi:hypothetical protein